MPQSTVVTQLRQEGSSCMQLDTHNSAQCRIGKGMNVSAACASIMLGKCPNPRALQGCLTAVSMHRSAKQRDATPRHRDEQNMCAFAGSPTPICSDIADGLQAGLPNAHTWNARWTECKREKLPGEKRESLQPICNASLTECQRKNLAVEKQETPPGTC